jgi:uncharacterized protein (TIGR02231 family)
LNGAGWLKIHDASASTVTRALCQDDRCNGAGRVGAGAIMGTRPLHRIAPMKHRSSLACLLIAFTLGPAAAQTSRIEQVTVYPGLAEVLRSARVAAGARELVLDCLSPTFDMASLRVEADAGIRIGPVSAITRPRAEVAECSTSPLDARIKALEDRVAALNAESSGQELALGYLRSLGPADAASSARGASASAAALPAMLAAIQRGGQAALLEQHRLARERELLERELLPLRAERERQGALQGDVRQLRIALAAAREGGLRLRYQVPGPTWAPGYRATLDVEAAQVDVERLAQVSQRSGEDWTGIALRLSTGSPRGASAGPQPRPWQILPQQPPRPVAMEVAPRAFARAGLAAAAPAPAAKEDADADFTVQVSQGEFSTEFEVPGSVDVKSGGQRVSLALGSARWPATVKVQTTPHADASAWLVAEVAAPEGVWPDGTMQLLRGSQVVGQTAWRTGQRERIALPFGRDELVRVQVVPVPQRNASAGFIGSKAERRIGRSYTVENRHRTAIALEVLEASPVSSDERIEVTRQFDPAPRAGLWQDQPGVIVWARSLAPGETARFGAEYVITSPKDLPLFDQR